MTDIFTTLEDAFVSDKAGPEERAALKAAQPYFDRLCQLLTLEEADELWFAAVQAGLADGHSRFAAGFRLGARLMLEVLEGEG